jgi:hypothetical protein
MKYTDDELIAAHKEHGSQKRAAEALGINRRTFERRWAGIVRKGYSPEHNMTHPVPDGFLAKGVSTLYREDGSVAAQWVKSSIDHERQREMLQAAFAGMADELPRELPRPALTGCIADLLNQYTITDYHLGMLAWGEETGADWDIAIAERLLVDWFAAAIEQAPRAAVAVFAQIGDFLHWDGMDAVTPAHRNLLDADTRFQKLVRVAIRVIRRVIGMLLDRHERVIVVMAEGNHDPASSIWLREWLAAIYENEPRVTVDTSPDPYYCVEHGETALFYHHGHKRKPTDIDAVFVAKFREVFGRTKYAYAHMGHLHHIDVKETSLMLVEQHRTLAAPDAFASRGGWLSGRDAQVITYSKRFGEVGRVRINSHMLEAA